MGKAMMKLKASELAAIRGSDGETPPEDPNDPDRRRAPDDGWRIELGD
jgi:hypothetical protein